jgi:hypothetical protein
LGRDDTRLGVLATADVRQKVGKVGRPISDNEALASSASILVLNRGPVIAGLLS